ncbi:MAG: hypothetical protein EP307_13320 [Rhodobacteraceae bacterium]|nr:MAG: hypothetical protein EP307_13320 [Paracoccaceae bacterium]
MTRYLLPVLICLAAPVPGHVAAEEEPRSLMERGAEMFLEGLRSEMAPALEDLSGLAERFGPAMGEFLKEMGPALGAILDEVKDWSAYHPPEILPNGDILIRRKTEEEMPRDETPPGDPGGDPIEL